MAEWVYFIHAPRENFAETMTEEEQEVWGHHVELLTRRLEDGSLILAGPTFGKINTGICPADPVAPGPDPRTLVPPSLSVTRNVRV